jgi:phospholipid-transporting ATPase
LGAYDRLLNLQISLVILFQLVLCMLLAGANLIWRENTGVKRYYLALAPGGSPLVPDPYQSGVYESLGVQWLLNFLSYWILLSYLVPISLFVTLEVVRGVQVRGRERGGRGWGEEEGIWKPAADSHIQYSNAPNLFFSTLPL